MTTKKLDATATSPYPLSENTVRRKGRFKRIRILVYADFVVLMMVLFGSVLLDSEQIGPKASQLT